MSNPTINPASWVIVDRETGTAIFETFRKETAQAINQERYRAVPIMEYLTTLNEGLRA